MVLIVILVSFMYDLISDFSTKLWGEESKVGATKTEQTYFLKIVSAPCLLAEDMKGFSHQAVFDRQKLLKGDISCIGFPSEYYYIKITDMNSDEVLLEMGDPLLSVDIKQAVAIKDGDEVTLGKLEFAMK